MQGIAVGDMFLTCVMIRGPWVYLECLKEALDGAFALGVEFAPFDELLSLNSAKAFGQCQVRSW